MRDCIIIYCLFSSVIVSSQELKSEEIKLNSTHTLTLPDNNIEILSGESSDNTLEIVKISLKKNNKDNSEIDPSIHQFIEGRISSIKQNELGIELITLIPSKIPDNSTPKIE